METVPARNQKAHDGYRMQSWRYCPLCGIEFKPTSLYSFRDRWWMHFTEDHKRNADQARQLLDDCRPLGKSEWDAS
jgi:hypothetical protein